MQRNACKGLAIVSCVAVLGACSTTSVEQVWHDPGKADARMGKTLVIAVAPRNDTAVALEDEWVRQLQQRGIDCRALHALLPGEGRPDKQRVVDAVKSNAIDTVLVSRIVEKKAVQSEVPVGGAPMGSLPGYYGNWYDYYGTSRSFAGTGSYTVEREVAVLETNLYEASSEKVFWSARSDTFLEGSAEELIRGFVDAMTKAMAKSKVL